VKKRIMRAMPDAEPIELASFELKPDGSIDATYSDDTLRDELERDGTWTLATGWVTPADGKRFFDALDLAYANSSFLFVRAER
jgi:hypothetical protein